MPMVRGARYVYVLRDGRDVLVSLLAHRVRIGGFVDWCARDRMFGADDAVHAAALNDWQYFEAQPHMLLTEEACVRQVRGVVRCARNASRTVGATLAQACHGGSGCAGGCRSHTVGGARTVVQTFAWVRDGASGACVSSRSYACRIEGVRKMKAVDAALRDDVSTRVRLVRLCVARMLYRLTPCAGALRATRRQHRARASLNLRMAQSWCGVQCDRAGV
jgi:hypothetical protein